MDIAAMSMSMSQAQLGQDVSLAVLKKTMEQQENVGEQITEMMQTALQSVPKSSHMLDILA